MTAVNPTRCNRKKSGLDDGIFHELPHITERTFARCKQFPRVVARADTLDLGHLGFIQLICSISGCGPI